MTRYIGLKFKITSENMSFFVNLKFGGIFTSSNSSAYRFSENLDAPVKWINTEMRLK